MTQRFTRRRLIGVALAGSAGGSTLASGAAVATAASAGGDADALSRAYRIERLAEIAYRSVLATDVLAPMVRAQLRGFLAQELAHLAWLRQALGQLGAAAPEVTEMDVQRELAAHHVHLSLRAIPTQHAALKLLIDVESLTEGVYFKAISQISDPALLRRCAEAMGCEAQHWTALSGIQHPGKLWRSVPYPFVQGSP